MIPQTHPNLPPLIRRWGCYLCALIAIIETYASRKATPEDVDVIHDVCKSKGYIGENCKIEKPDSVLIIASQVLDVSNKVVQIGAITYGKVEYWGWVPDEWKGHEEWMIRKYKTKLGNHFVLCKPGKGIFYNPDDTIETWDVEKDVLYYRNF